MWHRQDNAIAVDRELVLDLAGPFRLREARGADLTPKSRKAQGLLALVATSPRLRRSRQWLQDKLWSDRASAQGSASLRQCLTDIRSALRDHRDCLHTDSGWVALDPERVLVNQSVSEEDEGTDVEFLEGLDIRDPEFENWLRDQRQSWSGGADRPRDIARELGAAPAMSTIAEARAAELVRAQEARMAALEQLLGRQALEIEFLKSALRSLPGRLAPVRIRRAG